ncbi:ventral expressed homeobox [Pangasianodon hypophthalmus]|uniref:ventral expressed homeobox n=1 Tax=Pangasianodon hypophthalmus TaxID=310915 RepID=UPI0023080F86|nr:ventral expressed homeobox [Pangasianodon hypophthalmus]
MQSFFTPLSVKRSYNMAKNFSVAWLSQSSQPACCSGLQAALVHNPPALALQTKHASHTGGLLSADRVKDVTKTPSSPTNSCGYTSGSESEVGDDVEAELGPNRRVRTKFTSYQIARLEKTFHKHKYLGASQRRKIAEKLHLSETQVKTWFQNRRMKLKREAQDTRVEYYPPALLAPLLLAPPQFQHHALAGQRLALPPAAAAAAAAAVPHYTPHYTPQLNRTVSLHQHTAHRAMIHPTLLSSYYY